MLKRVIDAMERIAPLSLAETKWDNVGLLIESPFPRLSAQKIVLTIDLTLLVLQECIKDPQVGIIIAYHPPLFKSFKRLTLADEKQKIALLTASSGLNIIIVILFQGISVYSPHTALDNVNGGINDWLAYGLGLGNCAVINKINDKGDGSGRIFTLATPISLNELVQRVKKHLKLDHRNTVSNHTIILSATCYCFK